MKTWRKSIAEDNEMVDRSSVIERRAENGELRVRKNWKTELRTKNKKNIVDYYLSYKYYFMKHGRWNFRNLKV